MFHGDHRIKELVQTGAGKWKIEFHTMPKQETQTSVAASWRL